MTTVRIDNYKEATLKWQIARRVVLQREIDYEITITRRINRVNTFSIFRPVSFRYRGEHRKKKKILPLPRSVKILNTPLVIAYPCYDIIEMVVPYKDIFNNVQKCWMLLFDALNWPHGIIDALTSFITKTIVIIIYF